MAEKLAQHRTILIDGFVCVFFEDFRKNLQEYISRKKLNVYWVDTAVALKTLSQNVFRVRPWFEPGAWEGNWLLP